MKRYAQDTAVPIERSRDELQRLVENAGGTHYLMFAGPDVWVVQFRMSDRFIRLQLPRPVEADAARTPAGKSRTSKQRDAALAQLGRQRWRALRLIVRAKLEAVASGIGTIESQFLSDILLPEGQTLGEWMASQIASAYAGGKQPQLLPDFSRSADV